MPPTPPPTGGDLLQATINDWPAIRKRHSRYIHASGLCARLPCEYDPPALTYKDRSALGLTLEDPQPELVQSQTETPWFRPGQT